MDEFMFRLLAPLQGMDGLALAALVLLFIMLHLVLKADGSHRHRDQAHKVR